MLAIRGSFVSFVIREACAIGAGRKTHAVRLKNRVKALEDRDYGSNDKGESAWCDLSYHQSISFDCCYLITIGPVPLTVLFSENHPVYEAADCVY